MIKKLVNKIRVSINRVIPFYNLKPTTYVSDFERDKRDLVDDLVRKRILIHQLNRRFEISLAAGLALLFFLVGYVVYQNVNNPQKKVINNYIAEFGIGLGNYGERNDDDVIRDAEIVIALSMIGNEGYNDASLYLSGISGENAAWLRALCFVRLKKDIAAKTALQKILFAKGKYSKNAKHLLDSYYQK